MSRTRLLLLTVVLLVGMTPLIASPGIAGGPAEPEQAGRGGRRRDVPGAEPHGRCGFDVWAHVHGTLKVKAHPSGADHVQFHYTHTFSGPGGSLSVTRVENARVSLTVLPDGTEVESVTATGTLMYHMVIPGYGSIANNSGREVFEITWAQDAASGEWAVVDEQIFFDSGPNNELTDAEFSVICAHLA